MVRGTLSLRPHRLRSQDSTQLSPVRSHNGRGTSLACRSTNLFDNPSRVQQNIDVPKPQHAKAPLLQPSRAPFIVRHLLNVLVSVDLDDQLAFEAHEVGDVAPHRNLPLELEPLKPPRPQFTPQRPLRIRLLTPKRACAVGMVAVVLSLFHSKSVTKNSDRNLSRVPLSPLWESTVLRSKTREGSAEFMKAQAVQTETQRTPHHFSLNAKNALSRKGRVVRPN